MTTLLDELLNEGCKTKQDVNEGVPELGDENDEVSIAGGHLDDESEELEACDEAALMAFTEATEALSEAQTIIRLNRQAKISSYTTRTALLLAKRANDALYIKYAKFNKMRLDLRNQIVKKYGTKAASIARRLASRTPTPNAK